MEYPLIIFDGVCNLCTGSIQFILKRDKARKLRFLSLQSSLTKEILQSFKFKMDNKTILFIANGKIFTKSTAILKISGYLSFPWNLFQIFLIIPKFIRDFVYSKLAQNRNKWFGKRQECIIPDESISSILLRDV